MNEKVKKLIKQKSTWLGLAAIAISAFGLESFSAEQVAGVIAGIAAVLFPEKTKEQ